MTIEDQIYKCNVCGNTVRVIHTGEGELVCCNKPMELKLPETEDVETAFLGDDDLVGLKSSDLSDDLADDDEFEEDEFEDEE